MKRRETIIAALDIGTTKICCIVGEFKDNGIAITGIGMHPSRGVKKGVIVDIENASESIRSAVEDAELMSDTEITSVFVNITGSHIESLPSRGMANLKGSEVMEGDIERALELVKRVPLRENQEIIHILPSDFIIDGYAGIKEPLGMSGKKLEVEVQVIVGSSIAMKNIEKCCYRNGLEVEDSIVNALASAEAVLTPEEKDIGVAVVDIGGGTTDIVVFNEGVVKKIGHIPLGGNHITRDIAIGLKTHVSDAEKIKKESGTANPFDVKMDEDIEVATIDGKGSRRESRRKLAEIIEARVEEIFLEVKRILTDRGRGAPILGGGVVVTGGTALLPGITTVAEQILELPAKIGYPGEVTIVTDIINSPIYSTCVGLLLYGARSAPLYHSYSPRHRKSFKEKLMERLSPILGTLMFK